MENKPNTDNFDALLYAAVQYAGQSEMDLYDSMDVPGEFSASFTHRMKRWIKQKERKKINRSPALVWAKRTAVVFLAVMAAGFTLVMSISSIREEIWNSIIRWYDEYFTLQYDTSELGDIPKRILVYKEPSVIPDGYTRCEIAKSKIHYMVDYEKEDSLITYKQQCLTDSAWQISNEDTILSQVTINGYEGLAAEWTVNHTQCIYLAWNDGAYAYVLAADYIGGGGTVEQLIDIAESIR